MIHKEKKPIKCDLCDNSFSQKIHLNQHILLVHEGIKPFKCELCDHSFLRKADMKTHVTSIHGGTKPFKCGICDKKFFTKSPLNRHEMIHKGKEPFKCELCDHSFLQKGVSKIHLASVHEGIRLFKCELCEQSFSHKGSLNQHSNVNFVSRYMTGPILEKNHMLAVMVRNPLKGNVFVVVKDLDFERRIQTMEPFALMRNSYTYLLEIKF